MSIHVQLERFEGPLGLLLHLIREQEMDIFNINIHEITRQYLEYIKTMRRLDLEVAGEFVAMAATLLHIKSRTLLPQYNEEGEEIVQEDPRKELVQRLLEYKKIKELSAELYKQPLLGRDVFARGEREEVEPEGEGDLVLEENPLFSLISAYRTAVKNMKKTVHRVAGAMQSIADRIMEIRERLVVGRRVVFQELITAKESVGSQVLVTFLSVLELAKMGFISVFQTEPFADIYIETKSAIDRDVVSRVENYDSVNADLKAQEIMNEAQLSLDEPVAQLEGEEAPVVEAGFAEAASDADIEAEEQRLFAADAAVAEPAAALDSADIIAAADLEPAPVGSLELADVAAPEVPVADVSLENVGEQTAEVTLADAEISPALVTEVELGSADIAPTESGMSLELADVVSEKSVDPIAELTASLDSADVPPTPPSVAEPESPAAPRVNVANNLSDLAFLTQPEVEIAKPEAPSEAPATQKQNLNSALRSALSAFDAFAEPAPPRRSEPEVES